MKRTKHSKRFRIRWRLASVSGLGLAVPSLWAADTVTNAPAPAVTTTNAPTPAASTNAPASTTATNAPAPVAAKPLSPQEFFEGGTNTFNNWFDLSAGGFFEHGNKAQFQQQHQTSAGAFGGVDDFHYQANIDKTTTMAVDGRALFDNHDYKLKLDVEREKLGYLKFSYTEFRTWYNGDGGFAPASGEFFKLPGNDALGLDRGNVTFEGGLTLEKFPNITFRYSHDFRDGEKSSTIWGDTHPAPGLTQGLAPSFYDIQEHRETFELDATQQIKSTKVGLGLRYEFGSLNDSLNISQFPGEPVAQKITDQQGTSYSLFNVHAFTESWIGNNLMFSSGYSYSDLDNNFTGSRIYGSDFDVGYVPGALSGLGYTALNGSSREHEYVMDLNLFYKPIPHLSIVPSVRVQKDDTDANSSAFETLGLNAPVPFGSTGEMSDLDVRERLDLNYNGITNWVFSLRGEWTQGTGNWAQDGGLIPINGIGTLPVQALTDADRFFQKYTLGVRWYPLRAATIDVGGYYKADDYNNNFPIDSTLNNSADRYPAYLSMQNFRTYDANLRLTLRPLRNLTLVSRYEYQWSTIETAPDPISGLPGVESSTMLTHILAQDVSWIPWSRLSLQAGANLVWSETRTPASDVTQAILDARNNYWTVNLSAAFVLDDKSDINLSYFYYRADDYENNSIAVPYGAGGEQSSVTATLTRRMSKNLRLSVRCGYFVNHDQLYGGFDNNSGVLLYTSLRYRF